MEDQTDSIQEFDLRQQAERVEGLLGPVHTAASPCEQLLALEALSARIASLLGGEDEVFLELLASRLFQIPAVGEPAVQAVYKCLSHCEIRASLQAALSTLHRLSSPRDVMAFDLATKWIQRCFCSTTNVDVGKLDENEDDVSRLVAATYDVEALVEITVRLPQLLSNACQVVRTPLSLWMVSDRLLSKVTARVVSQTLKESKRGRYAQVLLSRLAATNNGAEAAVRGVYVCYQSSSDNVAEVAVLSDWLSETLMTMPNRNAANLCRAATLFGQATYKGDFEGIMLWLEKVCLPVLRDSQAIREAWVRATILKHAQQSAAAQKDQQPQGENRTISEVVACLLDRIPNTRDSNYDNDDEADDDDDDMQRLQKQHPKSVLMKHTSDVAVVWSQTSFVRKSEYALQKQVSAFLVHTIQLMGAGAMQPEMPVVANLLEGVTTRLHSQVATVRKDGMRVAEALASALDQELHFEELDDERNVAPSESLHQHQVKEPTRPKMTRRVVELDPDSEYVSDDESEDLPGQIHDDDSVWNDEEDGVLDTYDIQDDEEDLRDTPRPLYLGDCLDLLRTPENDENAFSRQEAALQEVSRLVRGRPADLADLAPSLAVQLLRMENKFQLGDFSGLVSASLCSLTVEEPLSVGQTLIAEFFQDGSLTDRLRTLQALNDAALELSGNNELIAWRASKQDVVESGPRVSGKRHLVPDQPVAEIAGLATTAIKDESIRTRRWGRGKPRPQAPIVQNRFSVIAPLWFYSLVGLFMEHKDDSRLWGGSIGATLLARLFVSLATIVTSSGLAAGTDNLAKDLYELVWGFRTADVPELRASVLFALSTAFPLVRDETILRLLNDDSRGNVTQGLRQMAMEDNDSDCRGLARLICGDMTERIRSMDVARPSSNSLIF